MTTNRPRWLTLTNRHPDTAIRQADKPGLSASPIPARIVPPLGGVGQVLHSASQRVRSDVPGPGSHSERERPPRVQQPQPSQRVALGAREMLQGGHAASQMCFAIQRSALTWWR